jgi:hypothetical protein
MTPQTGDFYEDDENPEDVMRVWHEGDKGLTARPVDPLIVDWLGADKYDWKDGIFQVGETTRISADWSGWDQYGQQT